ncbi:PilW family protein [Alkalihalobacterium alkalinitrilicum]|uniref:PilW family protein n=1 Tax=Alkalihalobacterium alkalinitrilicum TaxID=427920 RepID=UPI000995B1E1|nr:prepilin-type N-terminal cleavage/methylation domain-containing protein [Alkalihalobacterium alkalinitrilicum]
MRNQRGITLVELLLTITIMSMISIPVYMLVNSTLKVHQQTSIDNQLQHEARFISQYMSEKIRDGAQIYNTPGKWELRKDGEVFIRYDEVTKEVFLKDSGHLLSNQVESFDVTPEPAEDPVKYNISLSLQNRDQSYRLQLTVYNNAYSRYKK